VASDSLIMFDFDGVIADSLEDQCRAFVETLQANGFEHLATPSCFLDLTETNWFEALAEAGVPEDVVAEIEDAFGDAPSPELFPGMAEVMGRLAAAYPVVVVTSSRAAVVKRILDEHGVRVFEILGSEHEASKTRKISSVRRRFGESRAAWYVCDTVGDVLEARAAGATTVGVAWGWHGEDRLLRAAPDVIARTPRDLLDLF
jgi:phosphoglycolate phosphatase